ncbi:MAG: hypothetical protein IJZ85_10935 [Lachnospiraceae bacterium]|nr:hypothetical protein [Lachnospiraceae bacterium]
MNTIQLHIKSLDFDDGIIGCESIWGNIYIEIDGTCFPDNEWYDAVSSVLEMWIDCVIEFVRKKKEKCVLFFMDGPYEMQVRVHENNVIFIACKERGGEVYAEGMADFETFVNLFLNCTNEFLEKCRLNVRDFEKTTLYSKLSSSYFKLERYHRQLTR